MSQTVGSLNMNELTPSHYFELDEFEHRELFTDCRFVWEALKNIKSYIRNQKLGNIEVEIPTGAFILNPELVSIGKGTIVEPTAFIRGPCIIGKDCKIRHGAYIRGDVIVGNACVIGHATEVKHSVFLNKAHAGHFAYVGDSILGNGVNLGAGAKCANLKLARNNVIIRFQDKRIDTNLRKFGAIIGDDTQLGCNCVSNPGTLMSKKSASYPCTNFSGFIDENRFVK